MGNVETKEANRETNTDLPTEDLLTCGICLEDFKTPKLLPCGHIFCQACLERYARGAPDIACPLYNMCRRQVAIPPEGVAALPGSFWVGNVRELLRGQRRQRRAPVGETKRLCAAHGDADFRCYCKDCRQPVCAECIVESHRDHDVTSLRELTEEKCNEAAELQKRARQKVDRVIEKLQTIDEARADSEKMEETVEKKITAAKEGVIKRAEENAATLISQARTVNKKRVDELDEKKQTLESYLVAILAGIDGLGGAVKDADVPALDTKLQALSEELELDADAATQLTPTPQVEFVPQKAAVHLGTVRVKGQADGAKGEVKSGRVSSTLPSTVPPAGASVPPRISKYGSKGTGKGQFECPIRATIADDKVYILDKALGGRVQSFSLRGDVVSSFLLGFGGGISLHSGGLLVDSNGDVYVPCSVTGAKCANVMWSYSGKPAKFVLTIGSEDEPISDAAFLPESKIAVALKGKVCIVDTAGQELSEFPVYSQNITNICVHKSAILLSFFDERKIRVFKPSGELRHEFGADAHLSAPCGLTVDLQGRVLVADGPSGRVSAFDGRRRGGFLRHVADRGDGLGDPRDVTCAPDGRAVVVDSQHDCVFIFNY